MVFVCFVKWSDCDVGQYISNVTAVLRSRRHLHTHSSHTHMVILQHSPSTLGHTMFDSIHSPISDLDDLVQNNERCLEGKMEPVPHKHTDIVVSQARASQTVLRGSGLWDYRYCGWDPAMLWPHLHGCQVYHQLDSFTKHLLTLGHLLTSSRQARETICWNRVCIGGREGERGRVGRRTAMLRVVCFVHVWSSSWASK